LLAITGLCLGVCPSGLLPAIAAPAAPQAIPIGQGKPAAQAPSAASPQRARVVYDSYILGPGDSLQIELLDIPELSGTFSIGPDGTLYLPRLRALYVEGLTVQELRSFLTQQFRAYVKNPELYIRPVGYRPVRIYVGGEVRRPGYYTLTGNQLLSGVSSEADSSIRSGAGNQPDSRPNGLGTQTFGPSTPGSSGSAGGSGGLTTYGAVFPTLFDAIRAAQGITPYSNLADIQVTRKQALGAGGGKIRTNLALIDLITRGDESQNIRLFDGDVVSVARSPVVLREQLLKAGQTNLNPQFISVFVSGRVKQPGSTIVPQGSSLNQALIASGGLQLLRGKVEFVRFTREGELDRRTFSFNPNAPADAPNNPVLAAGDIIRVQDSALSAGITVMNELTAPVLGVYSIYGLYGAFK
jgi:polysaccharide biosynthesis/export protein